MTTSWPAAATQMRVRVVSPAMNSKGIFTPDAIPAVTLSFSRLGDQLKICWFAYKQTQPRENTQKIQNT